MVAMNFRRGSRSMGWVGGGGVFKGRRIISKSGTYCRPILGATEE